MAWSKTPALVWEGTGSPEGAVAAKPGMLARSLDTGRTYVKASGTGTTGWIALTAAFSVLRTTDSTAKNNVDGVAADDVLTISDVPVGTYELTASLWYTGDPAADLAIKIIVPAGTTGDWCPNGIDVGASAAAWLVQRLALPLTQQWGVGAITGGKVLATPVARITTTAAGTVAIAWAQNTAHASDLVLNAGSTLTLRRLT